MSQSEEGIPGALQDSFNQLAQKALRAGYYRLLLLSKVSHGRSEGHCFLKSSCQPASAQIVNLLLSSCDL